MWHCPKCLLGDEILHLAGGGTCCARCKPEEAARARERGEEELGAWGAHAAVRDLLRCHGVKADGERCRNKRRAGSRYCGAHARANQ
jgi:hypothetical protein